MPFNDEDTLIQIDTLDPNSCIILETPIARTVICSKAHFYIDMLTEKQAEEHQTTCPVCHPQLALPIIEFVTEATNPANKEKRNARRKAKPTRHRKKLP